MCPECKRPISEHGLDPSWWCPPNPVLAIDREKRMEDALMIIRILLASAHPNPKEHPTMTRAWEKAKAFLGTEDITRAALEDSP